MGSYVLFRVGAGILVLIAIISVFGFLGAKQGGAANGAEVSANALLYGYRSDVAGTMLSRGEILDGFRLSFTILTAALGSLGFLTPVRRKTAWGLAAWIGALAVMAAFYWPVAVALGLLVPTAAFAGSALLDR